MHTFTFFQIKNCLLSGFCLTSTLVGLWPDAVLDSLNFPWKTFILKSPWTSFSRVPVQPWFWAWKWSGMNFAWCLADKRCRSWKADIFCCHSYSFHAIPLQAVSGIDTQIIYHKDESENLLNQARELQAKADPGKYLPFPTFLLIYSCFSPFIRNFCIGIEISKF